MIFSHWLTAGFEDLPVIGSIILSTLILRWWRRSTETVRVFIMHWYILSIFTFSYKNPWRITNKELQPRPLALQESNAQVAVWEPQPVYVTSVPAVSPSSENCDHSSWVSSPLECSCNSLHSRCLKQPSGSLLWGRSGKVPTKNIFGTNHFLSIFLRDKQKDGQISAWNWRKPAVQEASACSRSACHCDGFLFKLFSTIVLVPCEHYAVPPLMDRAVHIAMRKRRPCFACKFIHGFIHCLYNMFINPNDCLCFTW